MQEDLRCLKFPLNLLCAGVLNITMRRKIKKNNLSFLQQTLALTKSDCANSQLVNTCVILSMKYGPIQVEVCQSFNQGLLHRTVCMCMAG